MFLPSTIIEDLKQNFGKRLTHYSQQLSTPIFLSGKNKKIRLHRCLEQQWMCRSSSRIINSFKFTNSLFLVNLTKWRYLLVNLFSVLNIGCRVHISFPATLFQKVIIGNQPKERLHTQTRARYALLNSLYLSARSCWIQCLRATCFCKFLC